MQLIWLGQACFKISTKYLDQEVSLVTDPYGEKHINRKLARLSADIVTVSHDHDDHNNIKAFKGEPFVIDQPGEYEIKGILVYGIESSHDESGGSERGNNVIYRFEIEGMTVAHLGDLGHVLSDKTLERMNNIDILLIPVGGAYTVGPKRATEIINQIEPRIVVPMHYNIPILKPELKSKLSGVDKFVKEMGIKDIEKLDKLKLYKKDLPQNEVRVIILSNQ